MTLKIYCLNDDQHMNDLFKIALELKGYQTEMFSDTESVLNALESEKPKLLITTLMLPKDSGYSLVRRVRARWSRINLPIILLSPIEGTQVNLVHPDLSEEIDLLLIQPVSPHALADAVMELLKK